MSVINKMLQELERRQQGGIQGNIGNVVRVAPASSAPGLLRRIAIGVLLVALGGGIATYWFGTRMPKPATGANAMAANSAPAGASQKSKSPQASPEARPQAVMGTPAAPVTQASNVAPGAASSDAPSPAASAPASEGPTSADKYSASSARKVTPQQAVVQRALPTKPQQAATKAAEGASPSKSVSPRQEAEFRYQKAVSMVQAGRIAEAQEWLQESVASDASYGPARQLLASLLVDAKRDKEAADLLKAGLDKSPQQTAWAMMLARLQLSGGNLPEALTTLRRSQSFGEEDANYQALFAALLQRDGQHQETIERYQAALRKVPSVAPWWAGLGISLKATGKQAEARSAFTRAKQLGTLSGELAAFVDRQIKSMPQAGGDSAQ